MDWVRLATMVLAAAPLAVAGQAAPPPQLPPLTAVAVTGSARFSPGVLVAASGLQLHQAASLDAFHQAVLRLRGSGDFARVTYRYQYSAAIGTHVQFEVTDEPQMFPVAFDNFVWLRQDEVMRLLRSQIPLFCGLAPLSGGVDDSIAAVLEAYLRQHGVAGATVAGLPTQAAVGGAITSYSFFVQGVKLPVQQVTFAGAPAGVEPVLQNKAAELLGGDFSRARMRAAVQFDFLPELRNRGFLQAAIADPTVAVAGPASPEVNVEFALTPGPQYRWGTVAFAGNTVFDSTKLAGMAKLTGGEIADEATLDQELGAIQALYQDTGYLQAAVKSNFDFSQPGVAATTVVVSEGPQFRMGTLRITGVGATTVAQLTAMWEIAAGQPFRQDYLDQYVKAVRQRFNLRGVSLQTSLTPDAQHQVAVTIAFTQSAQPGGPK